HEVPPRREGVRGCSMSLALAGMLGLSPPGPTPARPPRSPAKGGVERQVNDVGRPPLAQPRRKGLRRRALRGRVAALFRDGGKTLQPREQLLPDSSLTVPSRF